MGRYYNSTLVIGCSKNWQCVELFRCKSDFFLSEMFVKCYDSRRTTARKGTFNFQRHVDARTTDEQTTVIR